MAQHRTTQTEVILRHMKDNGSITNWQAFQEYGVTRLSAIIFALRKRGYDIISKDHLAKNRYGGTVIYSEYIYKGEPKEI